MLVKEEMLPCEGCETLSNSQPSQWLKMEDYHYGGFQPSDGQENSSIVLLHKADASSVR
ncbi:MAG: hypothetical protein PF570_02070 [Candidatus Cloacimonetes bacterium]|jgi:hypothetical protein|nr:hypothetical protein [Candidatus Cloacimonadota bacterium]